MALETPTVGGRVLLTRATISEAVVSYDVTLDVPDANWRGSSTIDVATGAIAFRDFEGQGDAPEWLVEAARTFLRTVWSRSTKETPPAWPRRVRRWRAPKAP